MDEKLETHSKGRLFKHPVLEFFTKSTATESTISSLGIATLCIWAGVRLGSTAGTGKIIACFLSGILVWTLFEYLLHRYLFHLSEHRFRGSGRIAYVLHGIHHDYPRDIERTLMPLVPKLLFSSAFFGLYYLLLGATGAFFSAGFTFGYYLYSMMHYAIHHYKAPAFLKPLWHHHHLHHHLHHDKAFGVSSTFWDQVFGTMPPKYANKTKVAAESQS